MGFATGEYLEAIGQFWATSRLPAEPAITTLEFTLNEVLVNDKIIPAGWRVRSRDGEFTFATVEVLIIPAGSLTGTVTARCTVDGDSANGYPVGTIIESFDIFDGVVTNITVTNSGSAVESDDRYRERLLLAPNRVNTAGSIDSYRFLALSADSSIVEVGIESPDSARRIAQREERALRLSESVLQKLSVDYGINTSAVNADDLKELFYQDITVPRFTVDLYVLVRVGDPSPELLSAVQDYISADSRRPLTDTVRVFGAENVNQNIRVRVTARTSADFSTLEARLSGILDGYVGEIALQLGRDIVPSQIIQLLQTDEVYEVEVVEPADIVAIGFNERAIVPSSIVEVVGVSDD